MSNHDNYVIKGETLDAIASEVKALADTSAKINLNEITEKLGQVNADVEVQTDIITQIKTALEGKVSGNDGITPGLTMEEAISQFSTYNLALDSLVLTCELIRMYLLFGVEDVLKLDFPNAETATYGACMNMTGLTSVRFKNIKNIDVDVFRDCFMLDKVIIETPVSGDITTDTVAPCKLKDISAFMGTLIESRGGGVYVPNNHLNLYMNDTNWSIFPIYSIEENLDLLSAEFPDLLARYGGGNI